MYLTRSGPRWSRWQPVCTETCIIVVAQYRVPYTYLQECEIKTWPEFLPEFGAIENNAFGMIFVNERDYLHMANSAAREEEEEEGASAWISAF